MKKITVFLVAAAMLLLQTPVFALTVTRTFTTSASVPAATGVNIVASRVSVTGNVFTPVTGTNLSFNPLELNTTTGVYAPQHYFAIDIGASGGAGVPDVTVTYTEGANPNNPGHGLGWKASADFVKIVGSTQTAISGHPKKLLKDVNQQIAASAIAGGFLRIYLGIISGDPASTPAGGEPFTNSDRPGTYDGTLFISATIP